MSEVTYSGYLQLEKILEAQEPYSEKKDKNGNQRTPIHEEHMFIVVHQGNELWFKQLLVELDSIRELFKQSDVWEHLDLPAIISRLEYILRILEIVVKQTTMLHAMPPGAFMEFRGYLGTASGADSFQFRLIEIKLGLITPFMKQKKYHETFKNEKKVKTMCEKLEATAKETTLLQHVEEWLKSTPGLERFREKYRNVVKKMLAEEEKETQKEPDEGKLQRYNNMRRRFQWITKEVMPSDSNANPEVPHKSVTSTLSEDALLAAICINHCRNQRIYQLPFKLLSLLIDIDCLIMTWRNHHSLLVQRQIGALSGTGGSSGHYYLRSTTGDDFKVFLDLFNVATYLLPLEQSKELCEQME